MSCARKYLWILPVAALAGCATARGQKLTPAEEAEATITTLRAQNIGYIRRIEELQNRVFILEDRLDSQRVVGQQRAVPSLPVSRTLNPSPPDEPAETEPGTLPPRVDPSTETARLDSDVEYVGDAVHPVKARPTLRLERARRSPPVVTRARQAAKPSTPATPRTPATPPTPLAAPLPPPSPPLPTPPPPVEVAPTVERLTAEDPRPPEPIPAEPLRLYRAALQELRAGHHGEALAGFRRFLSRYPAHDYADNAQYWIGECYYDLKQHQTAAREFRRVIERYPRGNKVPDAMLKLGFSHLVLGQNPEGRQVLESLLRAYPKHASSILASTRLAELPRAGKADVSLGTITPAAATPPLGARSPEAR